MAGILCDDGVQNLNALLAAGISANGYTVGLFINNHTPSVSDTIASYTQATFGGYSQSGLTVASDSGTVAHIDTQTYAPCVFVATGSGLPQTVYGYFVEQSGLLIGAEKFATAIVVTTAGQAVVVIPTLSYQDRSIS